MSLLSSLSTSLPGRLALPCGQKRRAFTLIELLVVIAIIALLAAILFPVFSRARENARRSSCLSGMRQIALGMAQYMADNDDVYPLHYNGTQRWPQMMHPYVRSYSVYTCPSRSEFVFNGNYTTAGTIGYGMNYWLNTYYYPNLKASAINRPTETVWLAEIVGIPVGADPTAVTEYQCYPSWYGGVATRSSTTYGFDTVPDAKGRLATRHFDGPVVLFADGHAKWMQRSVLESDVGSTVSETLAKANTKYWWGR